MTKSTKYLLVGQNPINWLTGIDFPATYLNLSFAIVIITIMKKLLLFDEFLDVRQTFSNHFKKLVKLMQAVRYRFSRHLFEYIICYCHMSSVHEGIDSKTLGSYVINI